MREMKDSGVAWLGFIPADWNITRIKNLFELRNERNYEDLDSVNLISLYTDKGVVQHRDLEKTTGNKAVTAEGYKIVKQGDIVVNIILCWMGAVGRSDYNGVTSPAYDVYMPVGDTNSEYYHYLFRTSQFNGECYRYGRGIMMMRWRTYSDEFRAIHVPLPPSEEQKRIVNYLRRKTRKVDALISNQEKQIEKLKQYKQSLITEVVTKGLDPDAPMKDSKEESIGRIPAHWILKRAKYVATSLVKGSGITKEEVFEDGDIQCVRYGEIYSKYDCAFVSAFSKTKKEILSSPQYISYGDILFAGTGELVEEIGKNIVYLGTEPCLAGGDIVVMSHNQNPEYLNYALYGACSQTQKSRGKAKLKVVHISATEIGNVVVALPPLDEQEEIAK